MLYPFVTLDDGAEVVYSERYIVDGREHVNVVIEKPVYGGFHSAECILPEYEWKNVQGFSKAEVKMIQKIIEDGVLRELIGDHIAEKGEKL